MSAMRDFWVNVIGTIPRGPLSQSATPVSQASAKSSASAGPKPCPSPTAANAPDATATDLFFNWDCAELTDSDKKSLDAYATAYSAAWSSEPILVDAYASSEGDPKYNQQLSDDRANAVADYLVLQGVPKDKVTAKGHGVTVSFSKVDLRRNRRATIKPPPPIPPGHGILDAITIYPAEASIMAGEQLQFGATGDYTDGTSKILTHQVQWHSSAPDSVSIDSQSGVATAHSNLGPVTGMITATTLAGKVSPPATVTVIVLEAITIPGAAPLMFGGSKEQFEAWGQFSDKKPRKLTTLVWSSDHEDVISIEKNGLATAAHIKSGSATLTATHPSGVKASKIVRVESFVRDR